MEGRVPGAEGDLVCRRARFRCFWATLSVLGACSLKFCIIFIMRTHGFVCYWCWFTEGGAGRLSWHMCALSCGGHLAGSAVAPGTGASLPTPPRQPGFQVCGRLPWFLVREKLVLSATAQRRAGMLSPALTGERKGSLDGGALLITPPYHVYPSQPTCLPGETCQV